MRRLAPLPVLLLLVAAWAPGTRRARAEEAWETQVRQAEQDEDREIAAARERGTLRRLLALYESRASRQPTALNLYLLGRVRFHDGDTDGAARQMHQALGADPGFWFAHVKLAILAAKAGHVDEAETELTAVLRSRPGNLDALRVLASVRMDAKRWDAALTTLDELLTRLPTDDEVRRNIAFVHMQKDDWASALGELRILRGRLPNDPDVRWGYAVALYKTDALDEAQREMEAISKAEPDDPRPLEVLVAVYKRKRDVDGLQHAYERLLPLTRDPAERKRIHDLLEQIAEAVKRSADAPTDGPAEGDEAWPQDAWMDLVERCLDADVTTRRAALQQYYEADFPLLPTSILRHSHVSVEPDPICRSWVLRIIGGLVNPALAPMIAPELWDPDVGVRGVAAEALADTRAPAGVLYLMSLVVGPLPEGEIDAERVQEFNAARAALCTLTGHHDRFGGPETWLRAADVPQARDDWTRWLATPDGRHARLLGIHDLVRIGDLHPELFVLDEVLDADPEIARAAYGAMRTRAAVPSSEPVAARMWPRFPHFEDAELADPARLDAMRAAVTTWWKAWRKEREAATPDGGTPGSGTSGSGTGGG
jgi:tetratricopeptide (TPR) repeat protein